MFLFFGIVLLLVGFGLLIIGIRCDLWFLMVLGIVSLFVAMIILDKKNKKKLDEEEKKEEERSRNKRKIKNVKEAYFNWLNQNYKISKIIGFYDESEELVDIKRNWIVAIDGENKFIIFGKKVIKFEKIIKAELKISTSHHTKTDTNKNKAVGRAFLGGLIAGEAGAIIGAATATETSNSETITNHHVDGVIIYLSDIIEPTYEYNSPIEKCNRDVYSVLLAIIDQNKKHP